MMLLKGSRHRRKLHRCTPMPVGDVRAGPHLEMDCSDSHFADTRLRCELPTGHAGVHQAGLPRGRRVQWSVLQPS